MPRLIALGLLLAIAGSVPAAVAQPMAADAVPRFEPDSVGFPVEVPVAFQSTTGYLVVLEDRSRPYRPTLRLPVAVLRPRAGAEGASPVLYLSGGPGTSALGAAAYPGAYPWTADRPFVVFGQRGTRYAEPALDCPEVAEARARSARDREGGVDRQVVATAACRARLEAGGVDLAAYSTVASAADVEDLRRVLGVERRTLYGVSYGTRLALAVLRDAPGTVRAAVLDSVLPPQVRYDDENARNLDASIGLVLRDCAASWRARAPTPTWPAASAPRWRSPTPSQCGSAPAAGRPTARCGRQRAGLVSPSERLRLGGGPHSGAVGRPRNAAHSHCGVAHGHCCAAHGHCGVVGGHRGGAQDWFGMAHVRSGRWQALPESAGPRLEAV